MPAQSTNPSKQRSHRSRGGSEADRGPKHESGPWSSEYDWLCPRSCRQSKKQKFGTKDSPQSPHLVLLCGRKGQATEKRLMGSHLLRIPSAIGRGAFTWV